MTEYEFVGLLVAALITLITLFNLIYKPLSNINENLVKVKDSIESLKDSQSRLEQRVNAHGKEIDENTLHLTQHDKDIEQLKKGGNTK